MHKGTGRRHGDLGCATSLACTPAVAERLPPPQQQSLHARRIPLSALSKQRTRHLSRLWRRNARLRSPNGLLCGCSLKDGATFPRGRRHERAHAGDMPSSCITWTRKLQLEMDCRSRAAVLTRPALCVFHTILDVIWPFAAPELARAPSSFLPTVASAPHQSSSRRLSRVSSSLRWRAASAFSACPPQLASLPPSS